MNIPIYRAKKIDSDEYIEGFYDYSKDVFYNGKIEESHYIKVQKENGVAIISYSEKIDQTTLSIHFPDMLDSKGNKVFASLSKDGKGGDIIGFSYGIPVVKVEAPAKYRNSRIDVLTKGHKPDSCPLYELEETVGEYEVIGIKE